jgi:hypothetical protein
MISTTQLASRLVSLRRLRRQRGAALVEAAFMFPMFVICFYAIIYMHTFYATQIDANMLSRQYAWGDSMNNCGGGPGDATDTDTPNSLQNPSSVSRNTFIGVGANATFPVSTVAGPDDHQKMNDEASDASTGVSAAMSGGSVTGAAALIVGKITGFIAGIFPDPLGAQGVSSASFSWRLPMPVYDQTGGANYNAQQRTTSQSVTIMCNEKPQNGNPVSVIGDIGSAAISAIGSLF